MGVFLGTKALLLLLHLSVILLISSFTVLAQYDDILSANFAQPPHTSLPPAPSPEPSHKHRNRHHKHPQPPTPAPSPLPPAKAPTLPPVHSSSSPPPPKVHIPPPPPPPPPTHHHTPPPPTHHHSPPSPTHHHSPPPPPTAHTHPSPPPPPPHVIKPPSHPVSKKPIAVRGLVYCKSCSYRGVDNLYKATPIQGAVVKLACNNTKYHLAETATTDKNGFFLFYMPKIVTSAGYHKCKVFLIKSPLRQCNVKTNYKLGKVGAPLIPTPLPPSVKPPVPYNLYTVGPFAFEPSEKVPCPR